MTPELNDTPLTFNQFVNFYHHNIQPQFDEMRVFQEEMREFQRRTDGRFDDLYKKFETLNQEYIVIKGQLKRIDDRLDSIENRVTLIENRLDRIEDQLSAHELEFLEIKKHLSALETQGENIKVQLEQLRTLGENEDRNRGKLEHDLSELRKQVGILESRLEDLERRS